MALPVCNVVQKRGQRSSGMISYMLKFYDEFFFQTIINLTDLKWAWNVRQKTAVIRALKMQFDVWKGKNKFLFSLNFFEL